MIVLKNDKIRKIKGQYDLGVKKFKIYIYKCISFSVIEKLLKIRIERR